MSYLLNPRIYVACLAAYNAGHLHGVWMDANQSPKEIQEAIEAMLKESPIPNAEEWAIHDYEDFGRIEICEYTNVDLVSALAEFILEHQTLGTAVLRYTDNDIEEAKRLIEECYQGEFDSEVEFASQLYNDCYDIPDNLANYIDYQAIANDLFISDYFSLTIGYKQHIFCCN